MEQGELLAADNPWATDDEFVAQIAARARTLRTDRRLSLQDAADLTGYSKSHLWDFEQGKTANPTLRFLVHLARVYHVPLGVLLGHHAEKVQLLPEAMTIAVKVDALIRGRGQ